MLNITAKMRTVLEKTVGRSRVADVWLGDEDEMRELGKKWLGDEKFHEVISFPLDETGPGVDGIWRLGDVVVWERSRRKKYWVEHGLKHLLGVHHE